jgi:thioesterase domain-containing protein
VALLDSEMPSAKRKKKDEQPVLRAFLLELGLAPEVLNDLTGNGVSAELTMIKTHKLAVDAGLFPHGLDVQAFQRLYSVFRANVEAFQNYKPSDTHLKLKLWQTEDQTSPNDQKKLGKWFAWMSGHLKKNTASGWKKYASALEVTDASGNHYTILREPHVRVVAENLVTKLDSLDGVNGNKKISSS